MTSESAARGARGRPRSEASRRKILEAAWSLARSQPLARVSIEAVAREAGVGKTTIYRWWPGRAALICDAFLHAIEPRLEFPRTRSLARALAVQVEALIEALRGEFGRIVRELLAESAAEPEAMALFRERFLLPRREACRAVIEQGMASGELDARLDPELAMDVLYGPVYYRLLIQHAPLDAAFARALPKLVSRALTPRGA